MHIPTDIPFPRCKFQVFLCLLAFQISGARHVMLVKESLQLICIWRLDTSRCTHLRLDMNEALTLRLQRNINIKLAYIGMDMFLAEISSAYVLYYKL